jgi:hypothetical protein
MRQVRHTRNIVYKLRNLHDKVKHALFPSVAIVQTTLRIITLKKQDNSILLADGQAFLIKDWILIRDSYCIIE